MKFSIIINSHNQEKFINRSITSCLNQTFKDFEVIIVDTSQKKLTYKSKLKYKNKLKYYHLKSKNKYPEMNDIKNELKNAGALYGSMTGSGSTVYGVFKEKPNLINNTNRDLFFCKFL